MVFLPDLVMVSVIILCEAFMFSVVIMCVVMFSVVMLCVAATFFLVPNIRIVCKHFSRTNTLAYFAAASVMKSKSLKR